MDTGGIKKAFPGAKVRKLRSYAPDSICRAWELFRDVIGDSSEDKVDWAEKMGPHLTVLWRGRRANQSPSFRQLCKGLLTTAGEPVD